MKKQSLELIDRWFTGLNQTKMDDLLKLFAKKSIIKNAASPELNGEKAGEQLLESFFSRTQSRHFELIDAADCGNEIFAHWIGEFVFRPGIQIGEVILKDPLPVSIRGVERFCVDDEFKITRCDIVHETTSIILSAKNAKANDGTTRNPEFNPAEIVKLYFDAEEKGDVDAVVALCAPNIKVINAANPPQYGLEGVMQYVQTFKDRTLERKFVVGKIASEKNVTFAWWSALISFKSGISFGAIKTQNSFSVDLQGVCRFQFDESGKITELFIFHETTTAMSKALETLK